MQLLTHTPKTRTPWNKGKLTGQKPPFKLKEIWAIRVRLQLNNRLRDLALFNLAIDTKLRGCDLVKLKLKDVAHGNDILKRAIIMQQKTQQLVQFEIVDKTIESITAWIAYAGLINEYYLFKSRIHDSPHISTKQYGRIVKSWLEQIGLDPEDYGTHSLRRTKGILNLSSHK